MTPRIAAILRKDHMVRFGTMPNIADFSLPELQALDPFALFLARHRISAPQPVDISAYIAVRAGGKPASPNKARAWRRTWQEEMASLRSCLVRLGVGQGVINGLDIARDAFLHRVSFRQYNHGQQRAYTRSVSVTPEELPLPWRKTLARLRVEEAFAADILNRMEHRLCMFAWSAERAGLAPDINDPVAEQRFYDDLETRSRQKAVNNGEDPATAQPRWAYLRGAAEELRRFAQSHGSDDAVVTRIDANMRRFAGRECRQTPQKMFASEMALSATQILADTMDLLEALSEIEIPARRHETRMKACAIGITISCPPRARDVVANLVWGQGVHFDPALGKYRFDYRCHKSGQRVRMDFEPAFGRFFDALLLGDNDPRYLPWIRDRAITDRQPLFIRYDLEPVRYGWIGMVWDEVVGSGSHLMRTLLQTELADYGEVGTLYGQIALGHRNAVMRQKKYRNRRAKQISAAHAGSAMAARSAIVGDDIEDLL